MPEAVSWQETGFVVLGSTLSDHLPHQALLEAGLALSGGADYDAPAQHWAEAGDTLAALLNKVLCLFRRRSEIGLAQGEAVLNSRQCAARLLRLCVEPKLLHLLRSTPPNLVCGAVSQVDAYLHNVAAELFGLTLEESEQQVQMSLPVRSGGFGMGTRPFTSAASS